MNVKIIKRIILYSLIYLIPGLLLFINQRSFLYFPTEKTNHQYDKITFDNDGETIEVIVLNKGHKKALIYFGGNGESVVYNAPDYLRTFPDHTVYLFNYRGYGGSSGSPSEKGIFSDALSFYDRIEKQYSGISVIGRSLGSGVATWLAAERSIEKLVLVTPFDSIRNVAQKRYFMYPMSVLLKDKYDSIGRVGRIKSPTLALIAEKDTIIPYKNSTRLVQAFPQDQIAVKIVSGADHNTISWEKDYYDYLKRFIEHE